MRFLGIAMAAVLHLPVQSTSNLADRTSIAEVVTQRVPDPHVVRLAVS